MAESSATANPYVGPRQFTEDDADRFFGRDREERELLAPIMAERFVLFHAQSGAGKSSLVNTRIIPALRRQGFEVLPKGRISGEESAAAGPNPFVYQLMLSLDQSDVAAPHFTGLRLAEFLARLAPTADGQFFYAADEDVVDVSEVSGATVIPRALIVDQFEQLFTTHLDAWAQRDDFCIQLREALAADPYLWVILVMREDYVARLEAYAHLLPSRLQARYYMQRMEPAAALDAVTRPAARAGRPFAPGVAEELVDNLRRLRSDDVRAARGDYVLGEFVEPVQLQVVCFQLWESLRAHPGAQITRADLQRLAGGEDLGPFIDDALAAFYERTLAEVLADPAVKAPATISERMLRRWIEDNLISEQATRSFVREGIDETDGLPNVALRLLAQRQLIVAEAKADRRWYELIHDRFVDPILAANQRWRNGYNNPLERYAVAYLAAGRDPARLARGEVLAEIERFAQANPGDVTEDERFFLHESRRREDERIALERQRVRRRRLLWFATLAVVLVLAALTGYAFWQRNQADAARTLAQRQERQSRALSLAYTALDEVDLLGETGAGGDPSAALMLARDALLTNLEKGEGIQPKADEALRAAVAAALPWMQTLPAQRHSDAINDIVLGPDGTLLASASDDLTVRVWDVATGAQRHLFTGHTDLIWSVDFSPDGRSLISAGWDGDIHIWDLTTGTLARIIEADSTHLWMARFSPDGQRILSGGEEGIAKLWDARTGRLVRSFRGHTNRIYEVAFSPSGQFVLTGGEDGARLWSIAEEAPLYVLEEGVTVGGVAFHPSGERFVTANRIGEVRVWETDNGQLLTEFFPHFSSSWFVTFSPDGETLVSTERVGNQEIGMLAQWTPQTEFMQSVEFGHQGMISAVRFARDGSFFTAGDDGFIRHWAATGDEIPFLAGHDGIAQDVVAIPNTVTALSMGTDGDAILWDLAAGQALRRYPGADLTQFASYFLPFPTARLALHPQQRQFAATTAQGGPVLWDLDSGRQLGQLPMSEDEPLSALAFNHDGSRLAASGYAGNFYVWEMQTGQRFTIPTDNDQLFDIAYVPPPVDEWITVGTHGLLCRWDANTQVQVDCFGPGGGWWLYTVAVSPDGRRVAISDHRGLVQLWELRTGILLKSWQMGEAAYSAQFSADGRRILFATESGGLRQWDVEGGVEVEHYRGHNGVVTAAVYSADGETILSAGQDGTVRQWRARSIPDQVAHHDVMFGVYTNDGDTLITVNSEEVRLWDSETRAAIGAYRLTTAQPAWQLFYSATPGPDDHSFVTATGDGRVFLHRWGEGAGEPVRFEHELGIVTSVAVSPDGGWIGAGSSQGSVCLWAVDQPTDPRCWSAHETEIDAFAVRSLAFSPDSGMLASAGNDGLVSLWGVADGALRGTLSGYTRGVYAVAFSPDGRWIATGAGDALARSYLRVWAVDTLSEIGRFVGPTDTVTALAFSPDSTELATIDGPMLRVWDVATQAQIRAIALPNHRAIHVAYHPQDGTILTTHNDTRNDTRNSYYQVHIWPTIAHLLKSSEVLNQREPPLYTADELRTLPVEIVDSK